MRGSIITGVYPHRHGARVLGDALHGDVPTAARLFRECVYVEIVLG